MYIVTEYTLLCHTVCGTANALFVLEEQWKGYGTETDR